MNVMTFNNPSGIGYSPLVLSSSDVNVLFCKHVRVSVKGCRSLTSRTSHLLVTIEEKSNILSHQGKELVVKITDDSDPFLFYTTTLSENEFLSLKQSQGLLIDFFSFPQQLTTFLNLCLEEEHKSCPKYLLQLSLPTNEVSSPSTRSFSTLDIIETNPFKHLTHLSIRLASLDEASFKKYLLGSFQGLKCENEKLTRSLQLLQNDIRILTQETNSKSSQIDSLRAQFHQEVSEREKSLEQRAIELQGENSNLKRQKDEDQLLINNLKTELAGTKQNLESVEDEITKLTENMSSEEDIRKRILNLQESLERLQQGLADKNDEVAEKSNEIEALSGDLTKANEIIRKLQNEVLRSHSKLDLLNEVSSKQDHLVSEKEEKLKQLESDLKLCIQRMKKKEIETERHRHEVDKLKEKLDESQEQIRTNENLICWLNKQLASLKPFPSSPPERMGSEPTGVPGNKHASTSGLPSANMISSRVTGNKNRLPGVPMTVSGRPIITSSANNPSNNHDEQIRFARRTGPGVGGDWVSSGGRKLNPLALSSSSPPGMGQHFLPQVNLNDKHVSSGLNHLVFSKK